MITMHNEAHTVGSGSLGVNNSFGNSLAIESGKVVDQMIVLEQDGAIGTHSEGVLFSDY